MSDLGVALLFVAVTVSIMYFVYVVWNAFITKNKLALSSVDILYCEMAGIFGGSRLYDLFGVKGLIAVAFVIVLWTSIIMIICDEN